MALQEQPPIPMEELIRWCEANRPDVVAQMKQLEEAAKVGSGAAEATMFIISMAFNAGRTYQRAPKHADVFLPINKDPYV